MALIKTLSDLEDWTEYRKFVIALEAEIARAGSAGGAVPDNAANASAADDDADAGVLKDTAAKQKADLVKRAKKLLAEDPSHREPITLILKEASKTLKLLKLGYTLASSATAAATDTDPRAAAYAKRRAALESKLRAVTSQRLGDTGRITSTEAYMQEAADGGDWTKATASLGNLERLVSEAEVGPAETDVIGAGLVAYRTSLLKFEQAKAMAEAQLKALKNGIDGVPDQGDLVDALSGELTKLFGDIKDVVDTALSGLDDEAEPLTAAVRSELDRAHQQIGAHALLNHVEMSPWGVSVKKPLLAALTGIRNAMPA